MSLCKKESENWSLDDDVSQQFQAKKQYLRCIYYK